MKIGHYKEIFHNSPLGVYTVNESGNFIEVNEAACAITGYTASELVSMNLSDLIRSNDKTIIKDQFNRLKILLPTDIVLNIITKDGAHHIVKAHVFCISENYYAGFVKDITDQILDERAMKAREAHYKALFENSGLAMGYYKLDGTLGYINKQAANLIFGGDPKDYIGKSIYEIHPKETADRAMKRILNTATQIEPQRYENLMQTPNGARWFSSVYSKFVGADGEIVGAYITTSDITEQKKALQESEGLYQSLFENSGLATLYYTADGTIISQNIRAAQDLGGTPSDFIGKSIYEIYPNNYANEIMGRIKRALICDEPHQYEILAELPTGKKWFSSTYSRIMSEDGEVLGVQVVGVDITEQKYIEEERKAFDAQLRSQQRLESIGTLASGVAHEINNPINGILNYGQIILDSESQNPSIEDYAKEIIRETKRVSVIVKNLLEFSRQNQEDYLYASPEEIILKTLSLIKTVLRHDQIELTIDLADDLPQIKCRSQQIEQVIMNLVTNARDALNERYPQYHVNKKINIRCRSLNMNGQEGIRCLVEDFGGGISQDIMENIFEPFFTTKGRSQGTGLGLYISQGIIKDHHGSIWVESEEGEYTRFIVELPCDYEQELQG